MVRVRFAPSPTGFLHIGGARTALFNWLYARHVGGQFILRIEDTDELRSTAESVDAILESLKWLGLDWDEGPANSAFSPQSSALSTSHEGSCGPYFQMQRLEIYRKYLSQLEREGKVYRCYCSPEDLETMRRQALLEKRPPRYDRRCLRLAPKERAGRDAKGSPFVLRFRMPDEGETEVADIIRGPVRFENNLQQDLVIQKTSGVPTYNFACVVDDHLMEMTHVIRAEEHLSNTPAQIQMYRALGWEPPAFAHLSMILGPDGSKLSKRHGATSVMEYKAQGFLPGVLRNYLALLGWATEDSQDIFSPEELVSKFDLPRCQKSPAIFDMNKLTWMNGVYIRKLSRPELLRESRPFLGFNGGAAALSDHQLEELVALEQEKYRTLADVKELLGFFFHENFEYRWSDLEGLMAKSPSLKTLKDIASVMTKLKDRVASSADLSIESVERLLRALAQELGWKTPAVFHPLRFALSGRLQGPSLFHMAAALGKEAVLHRLDRFEKSLADSPLV